MIVDEKKINTMITADVPHTLYTMGDTLSLHITSSRHVMNAAIDITNKHNRVNARYFMRVRIYDSR